MVEFLKAMEGCVLAHTELVGPYQTKAP